jgi:alpha-beta hydrolase superfamily lysophospholipase
MMPKGRWRSPVLSWILTIASTLLLLRDRLLRVTRRLRRHEKEQKFFIASGDRKLACAYLPGAEAGPTVLLCHGIGETIEHWSAVQALFHDHGIGSLVFNYSGFGKSTGAVRAEHCQQDLVAAYAELRRRAGPEAPIFLLGFSLGSGIAAQGVAALHPPVNGLFLCAAFDSFREAACAMGFPRWLTHILPEIWVTVETVAHVAMPVWVVHSSADQFFPLEMAERITRACGPRGELIVVEGLAHNEPFLTAAQAYWRPVMERILKAPAARERVSQ